MFVVGYPINFTITGDKTNQAIYKHIREIVKMYGHLNDLADENDAIDKAYKLADIELDEKIDSDKAEVLETLEKEISAVNTKVDIDVANLNEQITSRIDTAATSASESANNAYSALAQVESLALDAWDSTKIYAYPDCVAYTDGNSYRCIAVTSIGEEPGKSSSWVCITTALEDFWDIDINGDIMPTEYPSKSNLFELNSFGDITMKEG